MIDVVTVGNSHLFGDVLASQYRLRYRVFVEREKYDVPSWGDMEFDQFDTPASTYLIRRDEQGQARAMARLIPTETPYMIASLWPYLLEDGKPPRSSKVWEATRFACDHELDAETRALYMGELISGCLEFALRNGIERYVCVLKGKQLPRILSSAGCDVAPIGPASSVGHFPVVASRVAVTEESLFRVRALKGVSGDVLNAP